MKNATFHLLSCLKRQESPFCSLCNNYTVLSTFSRDYKPSVSNSNKLALVHFKILPYILPHVFAKVLTLSIDILQRRYLILTFGIVRTWNTKYVYSISMPPHCVSTYVEYK